MLFILYTVYTTFIFFFPRGSGLRLKQKPLPPSKIPIVPIVSNHFLAKCSNPRQINLNPTFFFAEKIAISPMQNRHITYADSDAILSDSYFQLS